MLLNQRDINTLNLAMQILEIRTRFCQYGIVTIEEYQNAHTSKDAQPLVYNPEFIDDDHMYTIFHGYGNTGKYYTDIYVRYFKGDNQSEDFIEIAVPVVFEADCKHCKNCTLENCKEIGYYHLYLIGRNGTIAEDVECDDIDEGMCDCNCIDCEHANNKHAHSPADIERCRTTGAHNLCKCDCREEYCFVECGPDPEAECEFNENGRCHCPHNRCCGCDCECEPDEED